MAEDKQDRKQDDEARESAGVATRKQNAKLRGTDEPSDVTSRDDSNDLGVPMLPGSSTEPVGPEDALGPGLKRGDYSARIHTDPFTGVPAENAGEPVLDDDGNIVDFYPVSYVAAQMPNVAYLGDVPGEKGGVTT